MNRMTDVWSAAVATTLLLSGCANNDWDAAGASSPPADCLVGNDDGPVAPAGATGARSQHDSRCDPARRVESAGMRADPIKPNFGKRNE
ncbi:hypothetical protein MUG10_14585 [Xanthomonas prunicola]|uniref:Lipoprotein n=1 Tax=Xanthomonas prunicola TaxID=2053930 RepID=A0A9Q9J0L2_9XANT|nr:hypothetical protein [Xanthomonas prunicola]USI99302.1 hypothetical protein MUG10_14585 [Xanthomonas prunicola]UXA47724.1 hypothetical protein M0D44_15435 [Xanthomonas prunicola]UXA54435.1 hypothetical protein M0D45_06840 [Xanthomonas prunicola]UXA56186.1 hypothetical protein M0D47_15375 [Xanthomonas prunicola]UXA62160.1 hypothetical protein M0D48_03880 [Xanthomonas prunicola]